MIIKESNNWFNNENFWKIYKPLMFDKDRISDTTKDIEQIIKLCNLLPKMKVLDACCGEARHCIEFAKKGFKVTGVDITEIYLKTARNKINDQNLKINLVKEDIRTYKKENNFNFAMNFFSSFGYFEDQADDLIFCKNIYQSLKNGGKFLIDTIGKETTALNFKETEWFNRDGYNIMLDYKITDGWTHIINKWLFTSDKADKPVELYETTFKHRLYSAVEMANLLTKSGFAEIRFYGDLDGRPYDHKAKRMIAIGIK